MKKIAANLVTLCLIIYGTHAQAEIIVSKVMASAPVTQNIMVGPGAYQILQLPGTGTVNDSYRISINANNAIYKDISAFIVDENNLQLFQQGQPINGIGYQKAIAPFVLQGSTFTTGRHFLILDNRYAAIITKKLQVVIDAKYEISDEDQQKVKASFEKLYVGLQGELSFPSFNIRIEPCGQVNASSNFGTGDINYCSEMISKLSKTNNNGAFAGIFLHEVGHSLLGLWDIPGNNNEDIADEFATYMLMSSGPNGYSLLNGFLDFWNERDSASEAKNMLVNGDRHSLSIQRVRNIRENINTGEPFLQRWNRLLYPHFTQQALQKVIDNPKPGDSPELAKMALNQLNAAK